MPTFVAIVFVAVAIVGWLLVISNALFRRRVTIDLDLDTVERSSRFLTRAKETVGRSDVVALSLSKQMVNVAQAGSTSRSPLAFYLVIVALRDGDRFCLVRTVNEAVANTLVRWWHSDPKRPSTA